MYPVLVSIAGFHLSSFSIFFILAWCVFSFVFWKSLREEGVAEERIFDLSFAGTLAALVGARAGFVAFHWNEFALAPLKIVALWVAPGLSLLTALAFGLGIMVFLSRRANVRLGAILDAFGLALPGALVVGAVGSLLDGTVIGRATNVSWAIRYVGFSEPRHPYQLYEMVILIGILAATGWLAARARHKKWALGSVGVGFFLLWAPGVFGLEFLREGEVYWYSLTAKQWAAIVLFSVAVATWYVYAGGKYVIREALRSIYDRIPKRRS